MAVQKLNNKKITKFDTTNPNFRLDEVKEQKEIVNGNSVENKSTGVFQSDDVYGEKMKTMMQQMMGKLDKLRALRKR